MNTSPSTSRGSRSSSIVMTSSSPAPSPVRLSPEWLMAPPKPLRLPYQTFSTSLPRTSKAITEASRSTSAPRRAGSQPRPIWTSRSAGAPVFTSETVCCLRSETRPLSRLTRPEAPAPGGGGKATGAPVGGGRMPAAGAPPAHGAGGAASAGGRAPCRGEPGRPAGVDRRSPRQGAARRGPAVQAAGSAAGRAVQEPARVAVGGAGVGARGAGASSTVMPKSRGDAGQAVRVALADGAHLPGAGAAVDLDAHERLLRGRGRPPRTRRARAGRVEHAGDERTHGAEGGRAGAVQARGDHHPLDVGGHLAQHEQRPLSGVPPPPARCATPGPCGWL